MNLAKIQVGDNHYAIDPLPPMDALEFGPKAAKVLSPTMSGIMEITNNADNSSLGKSINVMFANIDPKETAALMREAVGQCWTPKNQSLKDETVFNIWFMEHPNDLYELGLRAIYILAKPYFPKALATMATSLEGRAATMAQSAFQSPQAGNQEQ